jgi:hypothetical protein
MPTVKTPDVLVSDEGTLFLFFPLTPRARQWIDANVQSDATWFGNALVVEHRYAWSLGQGMKDAGLRLAYGNTPMIEGPQQTERTALDHAIDRACEAQAHVAAQYGGRKRTRAEVEQFVFMVLALAAKSNGGEASGNARSAASRPSSST